MVVVVICSLGALLDNMYVTLVCNKRENIIGFIGPRNYSIIIEDRVNKPNQDRKLNRTGVWVGVDDLSNNTI